MKTTLQSSDGMVVEKEKETLTEGFSDGDALEDGDERNNDDGGPQL